MRVAWRRSSGGRRVGAGAWDGMNAGVGAEDHMLTLLNRHQVQTLLAAGHGQIEVAHLAEAAICSRMSWSSTRSAM